MESINFNHKSMLKSKYLSKTLNEIWEIALLHLQAFSEIQSIEELHKLRIEIKKIFSLIDLQQITHDIGFSRNIRPLRVIFSKAGKIRNIHLTLRIIKRYSDENQLLYEVLHTKLIRLTKRFCLRTPIYARNIKKTQKFVLQKIHNIEDSVILNWHKNEFEKLIHLFANEKCYQENMHKIRKIIKKLLYIFPVLHKSLQKRLELNKHYLHKLEEAIGKWHDTIISIEILSNSDFIDAETMEKLSNQKAKYLKICHTVSKHFPEKFYISTSS